MGRHWIAPATAHAAVRGLRRFFAVTGSSTNQTGLQNGSPLLGRYQAPAGTGAKTGTQEFCAPIYDREPFRDNNAKFSSQHVPALVTSCRTFSQSSVKLGKHSAQDTSGKRNKNTKRSAEKASQNVSAHMRPIVFECTTCQANCVTQILKDPYERGASIIRCLDCRSLNLISDQLGLFKEPGSIIKFLRERGVDVRNGPEGRYELTLEMLAQTNPQEASTA